MSLRVTHTLVRTRVVVGDFPTYSLFLGVQADFGQPTYVLFATALSPTQVERLRTTLEELKDHIVAASLLHND
jgi:hypothetical protein